MHFHLPKPLHGWREFAGEVGILFLRPWDWLVRDRRHPAGETLIGTNRKF